VVLGALALCWAALVNGGPFLHPDSIGYVRGPDVAVAKLAGPRFETPWAKADQGAIDQSRSTLTTAALTTAASAPAALGAASHDDNGVMGGRSIYYGLLAYLGAVTGGFWLTVFIQGLGVAWLVEIVLRALSITGLRAYAGVMALLALATPAPFFVAFLMPDIWVGVAIGAVALTFAAPGRLKALDLAALGAMTAFAGLAHNSAPPVVLALAAAGGAYGLSRRSPAPNPWPGLLVCAAALGCAVAGNLAFSAMVKHATGLPPYMPPFLSARVVADGPGTRFVHERCAGAFVVCRYGDRFPTGVDDFLWASGPNDGVFETASPKDRRALGDEQIRFVLAVARAYPLEQAMATARNIAAQAVTTELSDFDYKPVVAASLSARSPAAYDRVMRGTLAYRNGWPVAAFWGLQSIVALASAGAAIGAAVHAARAAPGRPGASPAVLLFALIVVGIAANAAVCGALSVLYGRYEARVIWTVPLAAAALALSAAPRRLPASLGRSG
jgi:hypothetical protein